jgi:hypothetical protein
MSYIGKSPAVAALTASDITDGIISNAKLAQDIMSAETALTVPPATTDEILISNSGVLNRIDFSLLGNAPAFGVRSNGAKALANTTITKLAWGTETFDTDSAFASDKFTVPAGQGGKYFFYASWQTATATDSNEQRIYIYKNGSGVDPSIQGFHDHYGSIQISKILNLSATDYIEVYAYQNSGGSVNTLDTEVFQGFKLIGV